MFPNNIYECFFTPCPPCLTNYRVLQPPQPSSFFQLCLPWLLILLSVSACVFLPSTFQLGKAFSSNSLGDGPSEDDETSEADSLDVVVPFIDIQPYRDLGLVTFHEFAIFHIGQDFGFDAISGSDTEKARALNIFLEGTASLHDWATNAGRLDPSRLPALSNFDHELIRRQDVLHASFQSSIFESLDLETIYKEVDDDKALDLFKPPSSLSSGFPSHNAGDGPSDEKEDGRGAPHFSIHSSNDNLQQNIKRKAQRQRQDGLYKRRNVLLDSAIQATTSAKSPLLNACSTLMTSRPKTPQKRSRSSSSSLQLNDAIDEEEDLDWQNSLTNVNMSPLTFRSSPPSSHCFPQLPLIVSTPNLLPKKIENSKRLDTPFPSRPVPKIKPLPSDSPFQSAASLFSSMPPPASTHPVPPLPPPPPFPPPKADSIDMTRQAHVDNCFGNEYPSDITGDGPPEIDQQLIPPGAVVKYVDCLAILSKLSKSCIFAHLQDWFPLENLRDVVNSSNAKDLTESLNNYSSFFASQGALQLSGSQASEDLWKKMSNKQVRV